MKRTAERVVAAAMAGVIVSSAAAQDAVQWRMEDGGNGHWYLHSITSESWLWHVDQAHAVAATIACPTTQAENDFLYSLVQPTSLPNHWIGFVQAEGSPEPSGGWGWLTGEASSWSNWAASEPNNAGGVDENVTIMIVNSGWSAVEGRWQDYPPNGFTHPAVYEWSADCNGDGLVDYGQILDGTFADEDGNGVPDCCEPVYCASDLNGDDAVGPPDLGILLAVWGTDGGKIDGADLNGDGTVNAADLGLLIGAWGDCGCH